MITKEEQAKLDANQYSAPGVDLIRLAFREGWERGYKRAQEAQRTGMQVEELSDFGLGGVQLEDLCQVYGRHTNKRGELVGISLRKRELPKQTEAVPLSTQMRYENDQFAKQLHALGNRVARLEQENAYKRSGQENHELQQQQPSRLGYVGGFGTIGAAAESSGPYVPTNARGEPVR